MVCSIELFILNLINMKMRGGMLNTLTVNTVNDIRIDKFSHHSFITIAWIININSLNILAKKRFYFTGFSEFENKSQCCKNIERLHVFMYFCIYYAILSVKSRECFILYREALSYCS